MKIRRLVIPLACLCFLLAACGQQGSSAPASTDGPGSAAISTTPGDTLPVQPSNTPGGPETEPGRETTAAPGPGPDTGTVTPLDDGTGSSIYVPGPADIAEDGPGGLAYVKGTLIVSLFTDPDEDALASLAAAAGGEIVGVQHGSRPVAEIRIAAENYEELRAAAESLETLPEVAFADPELMVTADAQAINTLTENNTPWSADGSAIPDTGNEDDPSGSDWWAEAIRAYSAWEDVSLLENPIPAGVIDSGFDPQQEDLKGRISLLSLALESGSDALKPDLSLSKKDVSHGTFVAGLMAAANNDIGIRGVADQSLLYCVDRVYSVTEKRSISLSSAAFYYYYNRMHDLGVRVINHSFGPAKLTEDAFMHPDDKSRYPEEDDRMRAVELFNAYNRSYEEYERGFQIAIGETAGMFLNQLLTDWINGNEDWICVQSAGNGDSDGNPISADLNSNFCSITKAIFNEKVALLKVKIGLTDEQRRRLDELKWEDIRSRILVVGAAKNEKAAGEDDTYTPNDSSNYGKNQVDIFAPGTDVFGLNYSGAKNKYVTEDGTSIAAPIVSGAATLLWSAFPDLPADEITRILKECTDKKVIDDREKVPEKHRGEYPFLDIGQAVEYTKYYTYVRDELIPQYGLFKGAQTGTMTRADESWLKPEGIVTAWIGDIDTADDAGHEMVVFRFRRDPDSSYSDRTYDLVMDLYTLINGEVSLQDPEVKTGFFLRGNYSCRLDLEVFAYKQTEGSMLSIRIDAEDGVFTDQTLSEQKKVGTKNGRLTVSDGAPAGTDPERVFVIGCDQLTSGVPLSLELRITDGCRLTYFLDLVFTDRDYTPAGYVSEYVTGTGPSGPTDLWLNPPFHGTGKRVIRTESYKNDELDYYHQFAYGEDGLLLYDGYFHADGDMSSIIAYDYDMAGCLIREREILATGQVDYEICYDNDANGYMVRKYNAPPGGGEIVDWNEYTNDADGNQLIWKGFRNKQLSFWWEYTYDAMGNKLTSRRFEADGTLILDSVYTYDDAGHLLHSSSTDEKGRTDNTDYEWSDDFHTRYSPWYYSGSLKLAGYDTYTFDDDGNTLSFYTWYDSDGHTTERKYFYQEGDGTLPEPERPDPEAETTPAETIPFPTAPEPEWPSETVKRHLEAVADTAWYQELGNDPNNVKAFRSNVDSVIVTDDEHLYFVEKEIVKNNYVYRIMRTDLDGQNKEFVTNGRGGLNLLDGMLYYHVRENGKSRVERMDLATGEKQVLASPDEGTVTSMLVCKEYVFCWLYFEDYGYVEAIDLKTGAVTDLGGRGADWGAPMSISDGRLTVISQPDFGRGARSVYRVYISAIRDGARLEKVVDKSDFLYANSFFFTEDGTVRVAPNDAFGQKNYYYHASYDQIRELRWQYQSDETRMSMNLNEADRSLASALISNELHFTLGEDLILIVTGPDPDAPHLQLIRIPQFDLSKAETVSEFDARLEGAGKSMDGQTLYLLLSEAGDDASVTQIVRIPREDR